MSNYLAAGDSSEPYITLVRAFSSYGDVDHGRLQSLVPYLERSSVPEGLVLWRQGDDSDGLYLIESGVLRASYQFADHIPPVEESMVPGTLAGELSALTSLPRNATVVVERRAVLWKLSTANMRRLELDDPTLARTFVQFVLKGDCSQTREALFANKVFSGKNRL
jgi:SulP family sulfate permease